MSNSVHIHLEGCDKIEVCENLDFDKECTPIKFGDDATVYATKNHLEELFEELDKKLHLETYSDLEDKLFTANDDLDSANDTIETLREQAVGE